MFWQITSLVILGLLLVFAVAGALIAGIAMTGKRQTLDEAFGWQAEHYDLSWFDREALKPYTVRGFEGYELKTFMIPAPEPSDRYVIISHGYTDNRFGALKYVKNYLDMGFNCVIYDLRGHGENAPAATTYGVREAVDLLHVIEDTRIRYKNVAMLGLHGESLGAATTLTCLKYKPAVDFAIADCPFAEIHNVLKKGLHDSVFAPILIFLGSIGAKLRFGVSFEEMKPILALKENTVPILLIHGAADDFIVPDNSKRLCEATKGPAELCFIDGAAHAVSVITDPEKYRKTVKAFLEKYMKLSFLSHKRNIDINF